MWLYKGSEFDPVDIGKYVGFVYIIMNNSLNKGYIGKKLFWFSRTRTVKGKKKRDKVESDWRTYWSSSEEVKEHVKILGEESFTREILHICQNKGTMSYLEAKLQFEHKVLEFPDMWYNGIINCRVHRTHVKL